MSWMFAAAREWMKRSTGVNRDSYDSQQLAEVIASHAPQDSCKCHVLRERLIAESKHSAYAAELLACLAVAPSREEIGAYEYKLPSVESGSITVSSQSGNGADSQRAFNPSSTSGVSAPEFGDDVARQEFHKWDKGYGAFAGSYAPGEWLAVWLAAWHTLRDLVTTQRKEKRKEA